MGYLKGARDLGIVFRRGGGLKLSLYVDTDYADKANDRRSVSGAAVMLGGSVVSATSTTQHCTTFIDKRSGVCCNGPWDKERSV